MRASTDQRMEVALAWATLGVPVLPVRAGGKAPHTRNGVHDASTDPDVLRRWWARWPEANIAIATGAPGVDVLDVDVRGSRSGWAALRRLRDAGLVPSAPRVARTPSGGVHVYFIGTDQRNGSLHQEHLDFRAAGGYVLVPPSYVDAQVYSGTYRWEREGEPSGWLDWQAVTKLLRPLPAQPRGRHRSGLPNPGWDVHALAAAVEREPIGNRNSLLFWAFCEALRCGYDLQPIAEAALRNPYQERITVREVEATWRSAVTRVTRDGHAGCSPALTLASRSVAVLGSDRTM